MLTKDTRRSASRTDPSAAGRRRLAKALSIEWLGQTTASLCWISSVFVYGISSTGDWLQLCAATSWLAANITALIAAGTRTPAERSTDTSPRRRVTLQTRPRRSLPPVRHSRPR